MGYFEDSILVIEYLHINNVYRKGYMFSAQTSNRWPYF